MNQSIKDITKKERGRKPRKEGEGAAKIPPFSIPGLTAAKRSSHGRIFRCGRRGIPGAYLKWEQWRAASVLPRWLLAIHNWEMGMGISAIQGDAQWAEAASLAAFLQRRALLDAATPTARACGPSLCTHSERRPRARG